MGKPAETDLLPLCPSSTTCLLAPPVIDDHDDADGDDYGDDKHDGRTRRVTTMKTMMLILITMTTMMMLLIQCTRGSRQFAAMIHKGKSKNAAAVDAYTALAMATRNGAKAMRKLECLGGGGGVLSAGVGI